MKVIEHLEYDEKPIISFEIIPPQRGKSVQEIIDIVRQIKPYNPKFIDVTSHSAEARYEDLEDGNVHRRIRRKRPGTLSICGIIQNRFNIDTVAHLLCRGFTREETEDALIELNYLGIQNILAIRGDEINYQKKVSIDRTTNEYAIDLVHQVMDLKKGKYLDKVENPDPIDMCIGVGGYPEKHFESPNMKTDIQYLKQKVDAGADYVVTQMFFENAEYFRFVNRCREAGITVPIIPGIKILDKVRQMSFIPKNFYVNIPELLVEEVSENPKHVKEIGIRWCIQQCEGLLKDGVDYIHFYIMNDAVAIAEVLDRLKV